MSYQYNDYLNKHKAAVSMAYQWIMDNLIDLIPLGTDVNILGHDSSKYSAEEYNAYDAYFYGNNKSHAVVTEFDKAWLHHIHNNPHHWQYWVLLKDDPETGEDYICIEMPLGYVIEMICDWWSFSFSKGNLREIFDWYDQHKSTMKLHPETRNTVELFLERIREKLDEIDEREKGKERTVWN